MANGCISVERILAKLDEHLGRNDYAAAERHLCYWLSEAEAGGDGRTEMLMRNELMGLYRKLSRRDEALRSVDAALCAVERMGVGKQVGAATTYLNSATVYKAFGMAERAMPLFERAREIYERELPADDGRLGGLYNNTALALIDLCRFSEAYELYGKAISVMERVEGGALEVAITYLNIASAKEAQLGLLDADGEINECLDKAQVLLDANISSDGYYAFVCEKCAGVFGYYGRFLYDAELRERARRIYEGT